MKKLIPNNSNRVYITAKGIIKLLTDFQTHIYWRANILWRSSHFFHFLQFHRGYTKSQITDFNSYLFILILRELQNEDVLSFHISMDQLFIMDFLHSMGDLFHYSINKFAGQIIWGSLQHLI